jgi:hypothetical protein
MPHLSNQGATDTKPCEELVCFVPVPDPRASAGPALYKSSCLWHLLRESVKGLTLTETRKSDFLAGNSILFPSGQLEMLNKNTQNSRNIPDARCSQTGEDT